MHPHTHWHTHICIYIAVSSKMFITWYHFISISSYQVIPVREVSYREERQSTASANHHPTSIDAIEVTGLSEQYFSHWQLTGVHHSLVYSRGFFSLPEDLSNHDVRVQDSHLLNKIFHPLTSLLFHSASYLATFFISYV